MIIGIVSNRVANEAAEQRDSSCQWAEVRIAIGTTARSRVRGGSEVAEQAAIPCTRGEVTGMARPTA
jgi:hypothetical protein